MTQKLKKDTIELKFLRYFSTSTLVIIGALMVILFPASILFVAALLIYIIAFKKQHISIITRERNKGMMEKRTNYLEQAITDALSVVGGVVLFFDVLSFFSQNVSMSAWFMDKRNRIWLLVFCLCLVIGRYYRYRKDAKKG